jgi:phage terminase Nu1 subunit (DNA packaging protein)
MRKTSKQTPVTAPKQKAISRRDLAALFGCTGRWISVLVGKGLPRLSHGRFETIPCLTWYIGFLRDALAKRDGDADGDTVAVRTRAAKLKQSEALAELRQIELEQTQGHLVAIEDVEHEMTDLVLVTKARIMAIAPRLAPVLVGETDRAVIQARIEKSCREALHALAKGPPARRNVMSGSSEPAA